MKMRPFFQASVVGLILTGCAAPAPQSSPPLAAATAFAVPMDPGAIGCGDIGNSAALTAATEWSLGQARAALLSGRSAASPTASEMSGQIVSFCAANPDATIRGATL
ncbi:MAG: hypothetical protein AAGL89_01790 [Pseudomonadota bacterium]